MSDTTSITRLDQDATNEVVRRVDALATKIGPSAHVSASVSQNRTSGRVVSVAVWPEGLCSSTRGVHHYGYTFDAALAEAEAWATAYQPIRRDAAIRKLALDIIDLKDQHGNVTESMLRGRDHLQRDIDALKGAACIRAGEMSAGAPFEVSA